MNYDERQVFEHELIDRRLTWLLTSQTILFAALAFTLEKNNCEDDKAFFTIIISCLGIVISLLIFIGVWMGLRAKRQSFKDEKLKQMKKDPLGYETDPVQWGVRTKITKIAVIPDKSLPIVFAITWLIILLWELL